MIDWLDPIAGRWAALIAAILWPATFVALIALGILIPLLRRLSPALAIAAAAVALVKFFVPPVVISPAALIDRGSAWVVAASAGEPMSAGWLRALMIAHLLGIAWMAVSLLQQRRQLAAARRAGEVISAGPLFEIFKGCGRKLELRALPALVVSPAVASPVALGVCHPAVVLPAAAPARLSADDLRLVMAHELVHHQRRDLLVEAAIAVVTAVWWFHPVVWALAARIRELREERCDAAVVQTFSDPQSYCRALLNVAASTLPQGAVAMRRDRHLLKRRFERLLRHRQPRRWQLATATLLLAGFALAALPHTPDARNRPDDQSLDGPIQVRERVERIRVVIKD